MAGTWKASWKGSRASVVERLQEKLPGAYEKMGAAQLAAGEMLADRIRAVAPRSKTATQHYADTIHAAPLSSNRDESNKYAARITRTKDENAVGIYARQGLWHWLEFGTVHMAAQPHIFPIYRASRKEIRKMIYQPLKDAVAAASGS